MKGNPQYILKVLDSLEVALRDVDAPLRESVRQADRTLSDLQQDLQNWLEGVHESLATARQELADCERARAAMQNALENRRSSASRDLADSIPDCSGPQEIVDSLRALEALLQQQLNRLSLAAMSFHTQSGVLMHTLNHDIPAAERWLLQHQAALMLFEESSDAQKLESAKRQATAAVEAGREWQADQDARAALVFVATSIVTILPNLFGGDHGTRYRRARQEFLRRAVDDPNQPSHVRGWIRQELNRLEQVKQAMAEGRQPPGGNKRHLRTIPGLDVGHRFPNIDLPENFRFEDIGMNRARPGIAKRLGLSESYR